MILVTVGMHTQPFDRLVRAADELASLVEEEVITQRGSAPYVPRFSRYVDYVDEGQMQKWLSEARIVISHGGAGLILSALQARKPLVIVPRLHKLGEHFDDHQLELAEALADQNLVVAVMADLSAEILEEACGRATRLDRIRVTGTGLQRTLRDWLAEQAVQLASSRRKPLRWRRGEG
jgi:beta-1,4-N-acetylglucosaminyltransferase